MMEQIAGRDNLSLLEYTARVTYAIASSPEIHDVWIVAELSDVAVRGGHFYADLIQKDNTGRTVARMRSNLWASNYSRIRMRYLQERGEDLRNGIKVRIKGSANHHSIFGLSFNISDLDPSYTDEGDILRNRMEILNKMKQEGVFDDNRDLELALDAQRIAVISASGAAGYGDFINQLLGNTGRYRFKVKLFESPMQGEKAPAGVINALQLIAAEIESWDCVVIIRGGGASADMNCFDNAALARNICLFPLPVIVGIGHERDYCVLDYIAHTRCKTPTAVAEFLLEHQREAWQKAVDMVNLIIREVTLRMEGEKRHIAQIETFVPAMTYQILERESQRLKNLTSAVPMAASRLTTREHTRLDSIKAQIQVAATTVFSLARDRLVSTFNIVKVLNPENTLQRGYSITRVNGQAVRDAATLAKGTKIETQLATGRVESIVDKDF